MENLIELINVAREFVGAATVIADLDIEAEADRRAVDFALALLLDPEIYWPSRLARAGSLAGGLSGAGGPGGRLRSDPERRASTRVW